MKNILKLSLMLVLLLSSGNLMAQKLGHIDSSTLLSMMPEAKAAEKSLEVFSNQLNSQLETMVTKVQNEYKDFMDKANKGLVTPNEMTQQEQYFATKQEEIGKFQAEAEGKIMKKRESEFGPILKTAEEAIKAVAADGGYTYIFDTSLGVLLYAQPSDDITALVKQRMGIN